MSSNYEEALSFYAQNLYNKNLPVIYSLKHFSMMVDIPYKKIKDIIKNRKDFYNTFYIKKKNRGLRQIKAPIDELRYLQKVILDNILNKIPLDDSCMSYRQNISIYDNASIHQNQPILYHFDLYKFFDTITEKRIYGFFRFLGYHPNLALDFAKLTTIPLSSEYIQMISDDETSPPFFPLDKNLGRLPQGAPTSPMLSNIILNKVDIRFRNLAKKQNINYSRYADDLIFSGQKKNLPSKNFIKQIITEEGFFCNDKKTKTMIKGQKQYVTGLTVTDGVHVPKKYKKDIINALYYCQKYGVQSHLKKINSNKFGFKDWLLGKIFFVKSIEPTLGNKFLNQFNSIDWVGLV